MEEMLSYEEMENQDLIHLLVEGRDDQAFEVLYERHRSTVYFFLRKYYGHIEDVDDYFQLAAISLCEVCQDFQALGYSYSLFSALGRRIESRIIDQMRKQASKKRLPKAKRVYYDGIVCEDGGPAFLNQIPQRHYSSPDQAYLLKESYQTYQLTLSPLERAVLNGHLAQKSDETLAQELGVSVKQVRHAYYRLRAKWRRHQAEEN
ncbi:sigma-70 family RNA polymerase sigma factor [Aerococcus tenax]|nr:sigma-70 family RNA polymerase sigma factor [Aerococcus tenax]RAV92548.1 hypothetical protein DBT45_03545 [Aerococcus tenax]